YREAAGFDDEQRAIPSAPGLSQTEQRAHWWGAWEALGRPIETRAEAVLTDGQLAARVGAWEREQAWAPPHADAALKHAELTAEPRRPPIRSKRGGHARRQALLSSPTRSNSKWR